MRLKREKKIKILITGASGFVGSAIFTELCKENFELYTLNKSKINVNSNKSKAQEEYFVDLTSKESLIKTIVCRKFDVIIHAAGLAHQFSNITDRDFEKTNVLGTKNILDIAKLKYVKHFVLISSVSVYGKNSKNKNYSQPIDETSPCNPINSYSKSKYKAEWISREFCLQNEINLTIIRPSTVVGENDKGNFLRLIKSIDKRHFIWIGKGTNKKSIVYRGDLAKACQKIVLNENTKPFQLYNISAPAVNVSEIVKVISQVLERKVLKFSIPPKIILQILKKLLQVSKAERISDHIETIEKWLSDDIISAEKFSNDFDFDDWVSPSEAIEREVLWYKKNT